MSLVVFDARTGSPDQPLYRLNQFSRRIHAVFVGDASQDQAGEFDTSTAIILNQALLGFPELTLLTPDAQSDSMAFFLLTADDQNTI